MGKALELAKRARDAGEVPVGAVAVVGELVVAGAYNERESSHSPVAHAELLVLERAARRLGRWRLFDLEIFSTLEPCPMCAGALVNARVPRLVYGASDPKAGASKSLFTITEDPRLNHRVEVVEGVRADEAAQLLRAFFKHQRTSAG